VLGIGTSAFSHLGGVNHQNLPALDEYLEHVEGGELPLFRLYAASAEELLVREFVLQLKLGRIERAGFAAKFGVDVGERFAEPLRDLTARGWLVVDEEAVTVTREGLARIDRCLESFYLPQHRGVRYS